MDNNAVPPTSAKNRLIRLSISHRLSGIDNRQWRAATTTPASVLLCAVGPAVPLSRVVALVGGFALISAFFMPWFASQGLLLSGQFLNDFLASASLADLQRFVPGTSPAEAQLLRLLVDLFPAFGGLAVALCVLLSLRHHAVLKITLGVCGIIPLAAWAIGITRLPPGSPPQIGLWFIACGSLSIVAGAALEFQQTAPRDTVRLRHRRPG